MVGISAALFFLWGILLVVLGASQDDVARDLSLDLSDWGLLTAALPLGAGLGIVAAGPVFDRLPRGRMFAIACALAGVVLSSVHRDMTFAGAMLRIAVAGIGAGAYNTVINAALAERFGDKSAQPLMLVHATATLGAIAGAPLVGWLAGAAHWTLAFRLLGGAHLALGVASMFVRLPDRAREPSAVSGAEIAPYLCAAFAYVGIEATATSFAVPYAIEAAGLPASRGRLAISALWLGVLGSRMLALMWGRRLGRLALVAGGLCGAIMLAGGALAGMRAVELHFAAVGLAVGFAYPLLMTLIGVRFASSRGTAAGLAGGAGAAGGFVAPWLAGALGERAGVGTAIAGLALWSAALAVAGAFMRRGKPTRLALWL